MGFAESQKEDHQFNPITSFPWCCVAKIKIKPGLFNGQKAKTDNLTSRRRQKVHPGRASETHSRPGGGGRAARAGGGRGGEGAAHFPARSRVQGKAGFAALLLRLPRKGSELPDRYLGIRPAFCSNATLDLSQCKHAGGIKMRQGISVIVLSR